MKSKTEQFYYCTGFEPFLFKIMINKLLTYRCLMSLNASINKPNIQQSWQPCTICSSSDEHIIMQTLAFLQERPVVWIIYIKAKVALQSFQMVATTLPSIRMSYLIFGGWNWKFLNLENFSLKCSLKCSEYLGLGLYSVLYHSTRWTERKDLICAQRWFDRNEALSLWLFNLC